MYIATFIHSANLEPPLDEPDVLAASCSIAKAAGFTLTMSDSGGATSLLAGAEEGGGGRRDSWTGSEVGLCISTEWVGLDDMAGELI